VLKDMGLSGFDDELSDTLLAGEGSASGEDEKEASLFLFGVPRCRFNLGRTFPVKGASKGVVSAGEGSA
jgi:hypothetical protein